MTVREYELANRQCDKPTTGLCFPSTLASLPEISVFIPFPVSIDSKQLRAQPGMELAPQRE